MSTDEIIRYWKDPERGNQLSSEPGNSPPNPSGYEELDNDDLQWITGSNGEYYSGEGCFDSKMMCSWECPSVWCYSEQRCWTYEC